jgi:hypothetical protein
MKDHTTKEKPGRNNIRPTLERNSTPRTTKEG